MAAVFYSYVFESRKNKALCENIVDTYSVDCERLVNQEMKRIKGKANKK